MALLSVVAMSSLAMPLNVAQPHPAPEKLPPTEPLPAGVPVGSPVGSPVGGRGELAGEAQAMLAWYCGEPGHEVALPCLAHQLRALPKGPERDALQLKMHEAAEHEASKHASKRGGGEGKGGEGERHLGPQGRGAVREMHEGWCARAENAESALCRTWRESAQRRRAAEEEKRAHPEDPHYKSEYEDMFAAYCDEHPTNAETFPCLARRLKASAPSSAERLALVPRFTAINPTDRERQREEMFRFWCEDSATDRRESGVCLSWLKRSQIANLHDADGNARHLELPVGKGGGEGGRGDQATGLAAATPQQQQIAHLAALKQRGEIERMHEWYCTSLDGTHDTFLCAKWRLRLKGSVDAYDAVARQKDEQYVKKISEAVGDRMSELQQRLHLAKEQAAAEETARLEASLEQARRVGEEEYVAMHKAWCTEGKGKEDPDSLVCKRFFEAMGKAEL